jgi:hypothetical protein
MVVMKLRMRECGIPAFSAAAAEYSMNPRETLNKFSLSTGR